MPVDIPDKTEIGGWVIIAMALGGIFIHAIKGRLDLSYKKRQLEVQKLELEIRELKCKSGLTAATENSIEKPTVNLIVVVSRDQKFLRIIGLVAGLTQFVMAWSVSIAFKAFKIEWFDWNSDQIQSFISEFISSLICSLIGWHLAPLLAILSKNKILIYIVLTVVFVEARNSIMGIIYPLTGSIFQAYFIHHSVP